MANAGRLRSGGEPAEAPGGGQSPRLGKDRPTGVPLPDCPRTYLAHPRCWAPVVCCGCKHWQYLQNPLPAVNYNVLRERSSSSLPSKGAARGPRVSHKELPSGARQTCTFFWQVTRALTFHEEPFQSGDQLIRHRAPRAGAGRFTPRWWVGQRFQNRFVG